MNSSLFFDLSLFAHPAIFDSTEFVWQALGRIHNYCAQVVSSDIKGTIETGAHIIGPVVIGEGTVVEAGAFIRGPVIIGRNCEIRSNAYIRGDVIIGDECIVGNSSELKTTIMLNGAKAPHYNYCGDSIIGSRVNLGAGTKLSNFRFDGKNILVRVDGRTVDSGLRKFGAILGDGSQTGCNTVLNPGCVLGKDCFVFPGVVTGGYHPEHSRIAVSK